MPSPGPTATYPDLAGKVAVVTGGSRGIGAATARALADNKAAVAVVGRDRPAIDAVVRSITAREGRAIGVAADCTVEADLEGLHRLVDEQLGPIDILIAFAGGGSAGAPVTTSSETAAHWRQVIDSDLTATFLTISEFLPDLTTRSGVIVTMASSAARQATRASAAYAAAKAGVAGLTRHLAGELAAAGVRVNCIAPATIENDRIRSWMTEPARRQLAAGFPLARLGQPEDVAAATLFLASWSSSWITGITLDVAGGRIMA